MQIITSANLINSTEIKIEKIENSKLKEKREKKNENYVGKRSTSV